MSVAETGADGAIRSFERPLSTILADLDSIMASDEYDEEFIRPTDAAHRDLHSILQDAGRLIGTAFPLGTVYADGNGGLRLEWIEPNFEARIVIPAVGAGKSYLYSESNGNAKLTREYSAATLAGLLLKLNQYRLARTQ